jgi:uncharacterized membrane protein SirB2
MSVDYIEVTMLAIAGVGVLSLFVRRRGRERSSWLTWLLVPIAIFFAVPMGLMMPDPTRPLQFCVFAMVLSRWVVALARRERNYGWAFYIALLIAAETVIFPLAHWYADHQ